MTLGTDNGRASKSDTITLLALTEAQGGVQHLVQSRVRPTHQATERETRPATAEARLPSLVLLAQGGATTGRQAGHLHDPELRLT